MDEVTLDSDNGIFDAGGCLKMVVGQNVVFINKAQIRTIDIVRNDTIRIDIGQGALRNIYIRPGDVDFPSGIDNVQDLRDYVAGLLATGEVISDGGGIGTMDATQLALAIKAALAFNQFSFALPLREDESQPSLVYRGFAVPGADTKDAVWAIVRIKKDSNQIIYDWADRNENYDNVWDDRYSLQYDNAQVIKVVTNPSDTSINNSGT